MKCEYWLCMMTESESSSRLPEDLRTALRGHIRAALWFSLACNLLLLVSPLYMLQVYDRVLTSGSGETLLLLSIMAVALLAVSGAADAGRRRVFALAGARIGPLLERAVIVRGLDPRASGPRLERAVADLGKVQSLIAGGTIQPVFDAPFAPMFLLFVFLVHPWLGWLTLVGIALLVALAWRAERASTATLEISSRVEQATSSFLAGMSRQYSAVTAMGMRDRLAGRWQSLRAHAAEASLEAGRVTTFYGATSRAARQILQSMMLGLAAWLVLRQEISSGAIIASSILSGRAMAPVDQLIGSWKPFVRGRQAWGELKAFLASPPVPETATPLPRPEARLVADSVVTALPGADKPLIAETSFVLQGGEILFVVGRSGEGKTSLLQMLSTAWRPAAGRVTLGARDIHDWDPIDRGQWFGYLPQNVDLLPGTVRENIERFSPGSEQQLFDAARAVGAHERILDLPDGYDARLINGISAGQRQSIGLVRAFYGDPVLLLLDEPSANLDGDGVAALIAAMRRAKAAGRIAIVATHDPRLLPVADRVMELRDHRAALYTLDEFMRRARAASAAPALAQVAP